MKILHVVEPLAGGIVTFLKSLVENMPLDTHLIIHGERKLVMPFHEVKRELLYPNVKFLRWKSAQRSLSFYKDITAASELFYILKRLKKNNSVDVVHLHSSKSGFIGRIVCRVLGLHNIVLYTPNGAPFMVGTSPASNYFYKRLEKIGSLFGGQVVCCSPSEQKAYKQAGIDAIAINNGTKSHLPLLPVLAPAEKHIFQVVTAGRIVDQKNPAMFNAIAAYFEELPQFKFIWIGNGTEKHALTAKNIQVTGWLEKEVVHQLVRQADIYLSTANFEGLPFAVLEALALHKPVLLSDCTGNRDLISKGLNGSIFNNANEAINSILQFFNNSSMLQVMGKHSGAHCSELFNQANTSTQYEELYQNTALANTQADRR